LTNSPTITTPAMTMAGIILGTAAYMSPEQAKGRPADKRGDIWAFGCVLFEMLTGSRPFPGDEVSDTLAQIILKEPNWSAVPSSVPPAIHRVLRRCLAKDPATRLAHIADARIELDEAGSGTAMDASAMTATTTFSRRGPRALNAWITATAIV